MVLDHGDQVYFLVLQRFFLMLDVIFAFQQKSWIFKVRETGAILIIYLSEIMSDWEKNSREILNNIANGVLQSINLSSKSSIYYRRDYFFSGRYTIVHS